MNRKTFALVAIAAMAISSPAFAQDFAGPRVGVELGVADDNFAGTNTGTYGFNAGYDFDLGKTVVGVTADITLPFKDRLNVNPRELSVSARAGRKVADNVLVYGAVGYTNIDANGFAGSLDGVKLGLGVERSFGKVYAGLETRYANYEQGVEAYQTAVTIGYRF